MSKFKIGDWVQFIDSDSTKYFGRCLDIRDTYHSDYGDITVVDVDWTDTGHFIQDVEPWQPQEGEWCWFWNNETSHTPFLSQFDKLSIPSWIAAGNNLYNSRTHTISFAEGAEEYYINNNWEYCEPFIGTLPTFLQGK